MHISEGILPAQLCISGYGFTSLITWYSLRQVNRLPNPQASIPKASLLTAAFFVASSIHIPIPPASVHLVLNGLLGTVLGYYAFPAILIGLIFQAIMFGHGGLTTLGVNALIMGVPALLAFQIFQLRHVLGNGIKENFSIAIFGFISGAVAIGVSTLIFFTLIITNLPFGFDNSLQQQAMYGLIFSHIPLMGIEGIITAMVLGFLRRVRPELLPS
ncbi:MAG: cobalt transporter CbiM [Microcoleaceae cyanobacterium MO_207.B10]|nr:cobalt transporter CbiM [Microcoleaceae cyanobacterium MO_207.B10]